ncbi:MAG: rhomboid family intramembrane serine protease, partial [Planctomycetes bacterium]|nr:rhomboid family intramembrane serine protease [Planctomycetota bacterium]
MKRFEIYIYAAIILALNLPLATGRIFGSMIFLPDNVMGGQLWRIITHPFVHVSWYHLLLDGVAFFILYTQLSEQSRPRRTVYVASCGLTSMIAAWIALPASGALGYCGLSGIGHGLMAVCALEMIAGPSGDRTV